MGTNPLFTAALGLVPPWQVTRTDCSAVTSGEDIRPKRHNRAALGDRLPTLIGIALRT